MSDIKRIFVEKKKEFAVEADKLLADLKENLGISGLEEVRVLNRYDAAGLSDDEFRKARDTVFSEPPLDLVFEEEIESTVGKDERMFAVEYLPGQYDQRADSAAQCIQIFTLKEKPLIAAARVIILQGKISDEDFIKIKKYLVNSVDSREASLTKPQKLKMDFQVPGDVKVIADFIHMDGKALEKLRNQLELAMSGEDLAYCQVYFQEEEKRDPTITEIKLLDTYWSDHCRHTTFETRLKKIEIEDSHYTVPVKQAFEKLLESYDYLYANPNPKDSEESERDISLMKIATMCMKEMRKRGLLDDMEVSGEINACSIIRPVEVDGKKEEWLVMFKNETHNHPTEIEPFGGAATCLGGAIRDPLSGRAFVYQAMRVTGCADPRRKISDTLEGKLPQRKITREAARGYSSYGNQIGVPTGQVVELYNDGYMAKRMEVGAVVGAVPRKNVRREEPETGDIILLIGGRTGRDGIGGATGSSKEHDETSIYTAGAEVQKGNPPEERKLQRLFRNPEAIHLIKKSNDFGAGGVSVAIGELAAGLEIDLDKVPKKYEGLDGTELALSESQERMAVVVSANDMTRFIALAEEENLEATQIAVVTSNRRLKMSWRGKTIVNINRDFIDTNGVRQEREVFVTAPQAPAPGAAMDDGVDNYFSWRMSSLKKQSTGIKSTWLTNLRNLDTAGQKGLTEMFDSSVGAHSVTMPLGGNYQHTPTEAMIAKIPVIHDAAGKGLSEQLKDTKTGTAMSFGFNPALAMWSPFHAALYGVLEATAKIVAVGGDYRRVRTTLQEYFEKLGVDKSRWGKPFSALLGAYYALLQLGIAAIGGKDSMSGSFKKLDVPPTLITFAIDTLDISTSISAEFKQPDSAVCYVKLPRDQYAMPDFDIFKKNCSMITEKIQAGEIISAATVRAGGLAATISKMTFGNRIGFSFEQEMSFSDLFSPDYGSFILEMKTNNMDELKNLLKEIDFVLLGHTSSSPQVTVNISPGENSEQETTPGKTGSVTIPVEEAFDNWSEPLEKIFPTQTPGQWGEPIDKVFTEHSVKRPAVKVAKPRVFIPVFPGTNCEYETEKAFMSAGAIVETVVLRNLAAKHIEESLDVVRKKIDNAQIVMIPGGFSAGDEPEGSGKFIAAVFRSPRISEAVMNLLNRRDGLMLGICNGFQALIKLGLVPYGEIRDMNENSPNITFNRIGRHVSCMVQTRVTSTLSPWFLLSQAGDRHVVPVSHGEGRFIAGEDLINQLFAKGQVATQYIDFNGKPTYDIAFNPNGALHAIEGITSPDGRVLGKMGHSERKGTFIAKNVPGEKDQKIFASGVAYFS